MDHEVFTFFTTKPNDVVGAIHPKAAPVVRLTGAAVILRRLQRQQKGPDVTQ